MYTIEHNWLKKAKGRNPKGSLNEILINIFHSALNMKTIIAETEYVCQI